MDFRTDYQKEREAKEMRLYEDFVELTSQKGVAVTKVNEFLMKKYGIHSTSTLWSIRKRVEVRLKEGANA